MYEADKYVLFGGSKTFWIRNRRWRTRNQTTRS